MINNLEITGVRYELNDQIKDYAGKKIGNLDKYLPEHEREPVKAHIVLSEEDGKTKNRYTADVKLEVPHGTLTAKESTINMYAAIDIVEDKIKNQLNKHKDKQQNNRKLRRTRRMLKQFRERGPF